MNCFQPTLPASFIVRTVGVPEKKNKKKTRAAQKKQQNKEGYKSIYEMKRHERALRVCILPLPETYLGRENADLAGNSGKLESSLPRDLRGRISREVFALFHFTSLHPTDSTAHSNSRMRLFASPFCRLFFTRVSDVRRCSFTRCLTKKVQWLLSYRKLFFWILM